MDLTWDLNSPHLFFTLSAADLQWADLHKHMLQIGEPTNDLKEQFHRRKSALNSNSHIAAAYLDQRVQLFVKHFLTPLLSVVHFWYRYEWQERGSGHVHGFLWLKDAPNVNEINWELLKDKDVAIPKDQEQKMSTTGILLSLHPVLSLIKMRTCPILATTLAVNHIKL